MVKSIAKDEVRQQQILQKIDEGIGLQFSVYSWENMIDDLRLTPAEKKWAKVHTTYRAVDVAED